MSGQNCILWVYVTPNMPVTKTRYAVPCEAGYVGDTAEEAGCKRVLGVCEEMYSEERFASIIRVARIGEPETTLAVTSNRSSQRKNDVRETQILQNVLITPDWIRCKWQGYSNTRS
jgi:hypothetical protein